MAIPRRLRWSIAIAAISLVAAVFATGRSASAEDDPRVGAGFRSSGNGLIAFVSDRSGSPDIWTAWWDGDHATNLTSSPGADTDPAWSPDGQRIAFTSTRGGNPDVWVMAADGSNPVNLTANPAADSQPAWSPDGSRIAFTSTRSGSQDVWTMDADGRTLVRVTSLPTAESSPAWAPSGSLLAYQSDRTGNVDVWTIRPNGKKPKNLTANPAFDGQPAWSPDGGTIAYTSDRAGNREVYTMASTGILIARLTTDPGADQDPAFAPDRGAKVLFTTDRTGDEEVFYARATDGSSAWTLSHDSDASDSEPAWQPLPPPAPSGSPIEHVVILYMENHSFDNLFGGICLDNPRLGCETVSTGELVDGTTIDLPAATDIVPGAPHNYQAQQIAMNGGQMNGFSLLKGCEPPKYACYQQTAPEQIPNETALALTYAMSDMTFELDTVGSFGSHLDLAATVLGGFYTGDGDSFSGERLPGTGCDSKTVGEWQPNVFDVEHDQATCIPFEDGSGPFIPSDVHWIPTIMDRFEEAGLSWMIYSTPDPGFQIGYDWAVCPTFSTCLYTDQHDRLVDRGQFVVDAQAGTLPALSIVTPDPPNSQHNAYSLLQGDNWIADQVSAVMDGPNWPSTAIFITWDDCGCFYDHVPPPQDLGIREPFLVVSPYAKPRFVDHTVASFASMLAFTERTFGVAPLSSVDGDAYDFSNAFDFDHAPLPGITLTQHRVPQATLDWIAAHPPDPNDPT